MRFITPYKAAEGLGASGTGTRDHWMQTVLGATLAVLTPFFVFTVLCALVTVKNQPGAIAFFSRPLPAILTGLYLTVGMLHWIRGTRMMVDDYLRGTPRNLIMLAVTFIGWLLIAVTLWALVSMTITGALV